MMGKECHMRHLEVVVASLAIIDVALHDGVIHVRLFVVSPLQETCDNGSFICQTSQTVWLAEGYCVERKPKGQSP